MQSNKKTEKLGENLVINPFFNLAISKNFLTQKERTYPEDFIFSKNTVFNISLIIPEGYKTVNLPEVYSLDNELADIKLAYVESGNLLKIDGNYFFKKPTYDSSEYSRIRNYMDLIVKKFNEQILLEKI